MAWQQSEIETITKLIEPKSELHQKSALLRPLNISLIVIIVISLALSLLRKSSLSSIGVIGVSLILNILIFYLDRWQRTRIAAYIFCLLINLGLIFFAWNNLSEEGDLARALIFSCVLAMPVMLSGMLIGVRFSFAMAAANSVIIAGQIFYYFLSAVDIGDPRKALYDSAGTSVPITIFLAMIAVISWLYQRALAQAAARLEAASRRIMRDELLRRDLAVARELQQRLYPPPPFTNAALSIASRSEPARETSGDFYDFITLSDDRLGIVVADVTGKSIAAALVMAMSRSTLRSEATRHSGPADVLRYANQTLCQDNTFKQMITAFYGVLDTRTLQLAISNAGHPFPVIRRDGQIRELEICGLPLGARSDAIYLEQVIQLQPGDQLVLLSDGLIEERNSRRELFGFERMLATIARADMVDPEHALDEIWQAVAGFRGVSEQSDDMTLVVVQVAQSPAAA